MFKKILVALDHSKADSFLLPHIKELARLTGAEIRPAARFHGVGGAMAGKPESLRFSGNKRRPGVFGEGQRRNSGARTCRVTARHDSGEPARAILKTAEAEHCDLIAMTTHGHRLISDVIHGTTITKVRHESDIPLFLVKAHMD